MKISKISIRWEPAPVDLIEAPTRSDGIRFEGELFSKGQSIAVLPGYGFTIKPLGAPPIYSVEEDPKLGIFYGEHTIWEFAEPIEVDTLLLKAWDIEWSHTLLVDGQKIVLEPGGPNVWSEYEIKLDEPSIWPWVIGGTFILGFITIAMKSSPR